MTDESGSPNGLGKDSFVLGGQREESFEQQLAQIATPGYGTNEGDVILCNGGDGEATPETVPNWPKGRCPMCHKLHPFQLLPGVTVAEIARAAAVEFDSSQPELP